MPENFQILINPHVCKYRHKTLIMKNIFRNNRLIAVAFVTLFSTAAFANDSTAVRPVNPIELKYTGMIRNNPLFQLVVSADPAFDDFTIVISDTYGNNLYRQNIKAENFTKNFLLNADEIGDDPIRFEIRSEKAKNFVVYEISSKTRIVTAL
jgi:hypothetical protein